MFLSFSMRLTAFKMRVAEPGIVKPGIAESWIAETYIPHHELFLCLHSAHLHAFRAMTRTETYLFANLLLASLRELSFLGLCTCA